MVLVTFRHLQIANVCKYLEIFYYKRNIVQVTFRQLQFPNICKYLQSFYCKRNIVQVTSRQFKIMSILNCTDWYLIHIWSEKRGF